jgi:hypothetical protein
MNGPSLWRPFVLAGGLMLAVCLGGCSRGSAPKPVKAKTTWDDVVAARLAMRDEITAAVEELRKQQPGRIPVEARKPLLDSVQVMDERLRKLVADATRDGGPPPLSILRTTGVTLTSEAMVELSRTPPSSTMAQGSMMPPGYMPPGMMPPGGVPPGAMGVPRGAMPGGPFPPGSRAVAGIDVEGLQKMQKLQAEAEIRKSKRKDQAEEADRIQKLIDGYLKTPHRFNEIQKSMTAEQREVVKEMRKVIVSLRGDDLSREDRVVQLERQAELEQRYNELGDVEVERLKAIAAAEQKERQKQALALQAEANRLQEAHARVIAKANADRAAAAAKADAEFAARVSAINRDAEAARKVREAHLFIEAVNKERAKRNLPPLKEAFQPVRAPLTDRAIAPGFEVSEVSQLKARDPIYVHFDGKWHDATVQTKRGKIVTVKYVALENLENVTIERIRTHNRFDEPSKVAKPAAKQADQVAQDKGADEPAPQKPPEAPPTRVWTSSSGTQVDASLIGREGDVVQLKRTDGLVIKVPIDRLTEADQRIIQTIFPK